MTSKSTKSKAGVRSTLKAGKAAGTLSSISGQFYAEIQRIRYDNKKNPRIDWKARLTPEFSQSFALSGCKNAVDVKGSKDIEETTGKPYLDLVSGYSRMNGMHMAIENNWWVEELGNDTCVMCDANGQVWVPVILVSKDLNFDDRATSLEYQLQDNNHESWSKISLVMVAGELIDEVKKDPRGKTYTARGVGALMGKTRTSVQGYLKIYRCESLRAAILDGSLKVKTTSVLEYFAKLINNDDQTIEEIIEICDLLENSGREITLVNFKSCVEVEVEEPNEETTQTNTTPPPVLPQSNPNDLPKLPAKPFTMTQEFLQGNFETGEGDDDQQIEETNQTEKQTSETSETPNSNDNNNAGINNSQTNTNPPKKDRKEKVYFDDTMQSTIARASAFQNPIIKEILVATMLTKNKGLGVDEFMDAIAHIDAKYPVEEVEKVKKSKKKKTKKSVEEKIDLI